MIQEGPAKNPDGSTVIVIDLSFKYLGRHLDFGIHLAGPSGICGSTFHFAENSFV
jgi:hypothetical protein